MQIITDAIQSFSFPPCAATIGCFDGVHRGHQYLLQQVTEVARQEGLSTALITFPVHPRQVMQSDYQPQLLSCLPQKTNLIQSLPGDYCIMLPFTHELSCLTAREFMQFLHQQYNVRTLVIGYDHRFGHNRSEGFEDYCRYGEELHIKVVQAQALTEENISISSSVIRALLKEGNITQANHYLGYSYYLDGTVVNGYKVGRKLGFPTANLLPSCPDKLIPAEGVYAVYTYIEGQRYKGMLNILDFSGDIYHKQMRIEFQHFIRKEQSFPNLDALIEQLKEDRNTVSELLTL